MRSAKPPSRAARARAAAEIRHWHQSLHPFWEGGSPMRGPVAWTALIGGALGLGFESYDQAVHAGCQREVESEALEYLEGPL